MGVRNGNAQFQRMMEWVLKDLPYADVYVDDVIIGSTGETEQELLSNHAKHLDEVLGLFARHNLVASSAGRSSKEAGGDRNPANWMRSSSGSCRQLSPA